MPPPPPSPAFPYEVVRPLGAGGMGAVFEVRRAGDPRRLAAKFLTATSAQARARFQREGEVVARLEHPGIVPVLASGSLPDRSPYLIFELVDGRSLKAVLEAEAPLPEPRALALAEAAARALGHAHRAGVVHRDIKPDNILVDREDRPRIADFGIAHVADLDRLTRSGQVTGTVLYMAREQLVPDVPIGPWTDVHALGAVLFECLTGRPAFDGDTPHAVVAQVLHAVPPDVRTLRRQVSAGAAAVVARCLEKAPAARYADGDALADDLAALRRGESISAVSALLRAARRRVARRAVVVVTAAVALGVAGAVALGVRTEARRSERQHVLRERALELEALAGQLGPDAGERALDAAERALVRALAVAREVPEERAPERARLDEACARLEAARDRAVADRRLAAVADAGGAPGVAALASALAALGRVPPPAPGAALEGEVAAREEARGALLALAGRLDAARAALARVAPPPPGAPAAPADPEAWLAAPAARRAWRLAWVEARAGEATAALARLAAAPPPLRARLRLATLAAGPDPAAAVEAARATAGLAGPDAPLLAALARLEVLAAAPADAGAAVDGDRLALLADLRRVACAPPRARVPAAHQARASLAEGELCLALGWPASAAEAYGRALAQAAAARDLDVAWPAAPAPLRAGAASRRLAPVALAAALGLAAARSLAGEPAAAGEAAAAARARAALGDDDALVARCADLEAFAAALGGAGLGGAVASPAAGATPAAGAAPGAWGWDPGRQLPWLGPALRARLAADAWAELLTATRTEGATPPADAAARAAVLARRAVADDVGDAPEAAARAWAALAAAEAERGRLDVARAALDQARARAPRAGAPELHAAAARVALAQGRPEVVVAEAEAALAGLDGDAARRPTARTLAALELLGPLRMALTAQGQDVDALRVGQLLAARADAGRAPPPIRAQLHRLVALQAERLGRADARDAAVAAARRAAEDGRALEPSAGVVARAPGRQGELADTPQLRQAFAALQTGTPLDGTAWRYHHIAYGRFRAEGFDDLALAFEVDPWGVLAYLNSPSFSPRSMSPTEARTARASIAALAAEAGAADPDLPVRRDDALRLALAGLYAVELRVTLAPDVLARGLAAADDLHGRAPGLVAALLLGRLQVAAGDFGGAAETLARAERLPEPVTLATAGQRPWALLYQALALGGARRLDEARAALERLGPPACRLASLEGHRVREEPLLFEDPSLSGTLPAWAEAVAKALDEGR